MNKLTKIQTQVLKLIKKFDNNGITPKQIAQELNKSTPTIQSHLKNLLVSNLIKKNGIHPNIYYKINDNQKTSEALKSVDLMYKKILSNLSDNLDLNDKRINQLLEIIRKSAQEIEEIKKTTNFDNTLTQTNFAYITPDGEYLEGLKAFVAWIKINKKNVIENDEKFEKIKDELELKLKDNYNLKQTNKLNLIDATNKLVELTQGKSEVNLNHLYYFDKFSIAPFGRTRTALLTFQAKMNGDIILANKLILEIKETILTLIKTLKIDAVCFINPSIARKFQFMTFLEKQLNLNLPKISLKKQFKGNTPIQQKTLKTSNERVINATNTFRVSGIDDSLVKKQKLHLLIIDDIVGSGASMNIVAGKIKSVYPQVTQITGFAITGNLSKGFEIVKSM